MKKLILFLSVIILIAGYPIKAQVSINDDGSASDASAMLDIKSSDKGFLPPRMTKTERDAISSPAAGLQVFNTSTNRPNYYNGSEWMYFDGTTTDPLIIGDFHEGGVVFYLNGSGGGLVCAVTDQDYNGDFTLEWGCFGTTISGADGTGIGTGAQNTIDIVAGCTTTGIAAYVCSELGLNGYGDWFLPSKDELNEMYQNKVAINNTAIANGGTAFVSTTYWSSSEDDDNFAGLQYFSNGYQGSLDKNGASRVRAVRAF